MDECSEVAATFVIPPKTLTFDAALAIVREQMPDQGSTIESNTAEALVMRSRRLEASLGARLDALRNRATRYEVVLEVEGAPLKRLVAYTARRSRTGLLALLRSEGRRILEVVSVPDGAVLKWQMGAFHLGGGATVRFSGRTQRDAICNGELVRLPEAGNPNLTKTVLS